MCECKNGQQTGGCPVHQKPKEVMMIMRVNRLHHSAVEKRLRALNIHRSQHMLLMSIARAGGSVSQRELAERLEISPAAVAMSLKKMESGGFITRSAAEEDGRVNHISVSELGQSIIAESESICHEVDSAMLEGISAEKLKVFGEVLESIYSNLIAIGADERRPAL